MDRIRYLAASFLCLIGVIHLARLGLEEAPVIIVVIFGVAYLIIGGLLFRNNQLAYYLGAVVPFIGLCVGPVILANPPSPFVVFLGAIEIVVVVSCFYLIRRKRSI